MSLTDKCLDFRPSKGPFKQKLASAQSSNSINLPPLFRAAPLFSGPNFHRNYLGSRCSAPPIIKNACATEGPPIKTPSGPCWPPDEDMPRKHHAGAVQSHLARPFCLFISPSHTITKTDKSNSRSDFLFVLTKQHSQKKKVSTSGWLSINSMRQWQTKV